MSLRSLTVHGTTRSPRACASARRAAHRGRDSPDPRCCAPVACTRRGDRVIEILQDRDRQPRRRRAGEPSMHRVLARLLLARALGGTCGISRCAAPSTRQSKASTDDQSRRCRCVRPPRTACVNGSGATLRCGCSGKVLTSRHARTWPVPRLRTSLSTSASAVCARRRAVLLSGNAPGIGTPGSQPSHIVSLQLRDRSACRSQDPPCARNSPRASRVQSGLSSGSCVTTTTPSRVTRAIQLQRADAQLDGAGESAQSVFRPQAARAAMTLQVKHAGSCLQAAIRRQAEGADVIFPTVSVRSCSATVHTLGWQAALPKRFNPRQRPLVLQTHIETSSAKTSLSTWPRSVQGASAHMTSDLRCLCRTRARALQRCSWRCAVLRGARRARRRCQGAADHYLGGLRTRGADRPVPPRRPASRSR